MTARDPGSSDPGGPPQPETGPLPPEARAANLELWNRWTRIHETSAFYDVEGFKAGASSLWPLERDELGPLIHEGTTLLHLQCHFGLDTLSWARLGARVVGLDFSDEAVALARRLADEVGLAGRAEFVCADLYDADAHLGDRLFDVVFVSWGAIEWLPDLERWAGIVARHIEPGGTFYMAEMHPFATALDEVPGEPDVQVKYRLLPAPDQPYADPVEGSYADPAADTAGLVAYGWNHSFSEIIGALTGAGLRLEHLHEFPTSPAAFWDWMVRDDDRWWWLPDGKGGRRKDLPFSFSLRASKPADDGRQPASRPEVETSPAPGEA
jgi:SAM-dependent methyltransferase